MLRTREHGPHDRFDDPLREYRVRYLASTRRGAALEVLDHFRPDPTTEAQLAEVPADGVDILHTEPPGLVPEAWLSSQRFAAATLPETALFVDVNDADVLAELNDEPDARAAVANLAAAGMGPSTRLDGSTIRMSGPWGRAITQAVSRRVYEDEGRYVGLRYLTRFDDREACWAIFDDRVGVQFASEEPLDPLNDEHLEVLDGVAETYGLTLPINWRRGSSQQ